MLRRSQLHENYQSPSAGVVGFFKMLSKPWIHVPMIFGICLILLVVLWLNPAIDKLDRDIKIPLHDADVASKDMINKINNLIEKLSDEVIDWLNGIEQEAYSAISTEIGKTLDTVYLNANLFLQNDLEYPINQFLKSLDSSIKEVDIPGFGVESTLVVFPPLYLPSIPYLPTDIMLIPVDLLGIEKPISPWVDQQMNQLHSIANSILQVGIWLVVITGLACMWGFGKAFVPHKVNEFFTHPDFYENQDKLPTQQNRPLP